jgi:hypothetical protein
MPRLIPLSLVCNKNDSDPEPSVAELRANVAEAVAVAIGVVEQEARREDVRFRQAERNVREEVLRIGRTLLVLFLALREQDLLQAYGNQTHFEYLGRMYRRGRAIGRNLSTMFGVLRYHRMYLRDLSDEARHGLHPLDRSLGLVSDRFSWNVLSAAARLSTKLSFAEARETMGDFVPQVPSTEVIEKAVLGFGRHTAAWVDQAPLPQNDGEVLVIQIDSKGAPTATQQELQRRRGKHRKRKYGNSPRHRGRDARSRHPKKPRRNKGDKSKNAKMATMVVMYTLRRVGTRRLEGPLNRWVYASFAPKKHAFEVARRMADKRGFGDASGKLVQMVTDGDDDLHRLVQHLFPMAEHTVDYFHVCEYLWKAGGSFYKEGSEEQQKWVARQKGRLFADQAQDILCELRQQLEVIPLRGPGNKGRRERLSTTIRYLDKRLPNIRYGSLRRRDLEIGSGAVEGAVKHVIGRRCDHGGMRWIKERAECVLQLRCIEVNGDWDRFEHFVHDRLHKQGVTECVPPRLQTDQLAPLPRAA